MSHLLGQRLRHVFSGNDLSVGRGGARTTRFKPPALRDLRSTANNEIHDVDILFVHDIAQDPEQQWLVKGEAHKLWSSDILQIAVPRARILLYQYDAGDLGNMAEILSSEDLVQQAEILIGMLNRTTQPIIFVGYGYGGLVCEQVAVLFHNKYREMRHRITGFLFFGTPQASPGLAEWAILVAKRRGIKCAKTAQLQDWSSLREEFESFEEMQANFQELFDSSRDSEQAKRVACCFAKIRTPINEITLSPEWAILPHSIIIGIDSDYYGMTKLEPSVETEISVIVGLLSRWTQSIPNRRESVEEATSSTGGSIHEDN